MGWSTGVCQGTCHPKAKEGESCSPNAAKDFFSGLPTSAAHEYCETGHCICDYCANTHGKVKEGGTCATHDNCDGDGSMFCDEDSLNAIGCKGQCTAKARDGQTARAGHISCMTGNKKCDTCGGWHVVPRGGDCGENRDCYSNRCDGFSTVLCSGTCDFKYNHRFEIDTENSSFPWLDIGQGKAFEVQMFDVSNSIVKTFAAHQQVGWRDFYHKSDSELSKIRVRSSGMFFGIDQAGYYRNGPQRQWWGNEGHGVYCLSGNIFQNCCLDFHIVSRRVTLC